MKKILIVLFLLGFGYACSKDEDDNPELIGTWKLTEVLADPGDGSGTFHQVSSNKMLEFRTDGTITSNGSICEMSIESGSPSTGTYSLSDSTITSPDCEDSVIKIKFEKEGSSLIVYYPCIEGCMAKYKKE